MVPRIRYTYAMRFALLLCIFLPVSSFGIDYARSINMPVDSINPHEKKDSVLSTRQYPQWVNDSDTSATALDKIIVTASRIREYTPSKVSLDAKNFSGRYVDLQSALETVSGVMIGTKGGFGHYADASIRGSAPSQVDVYLDGIPLNGATGNAVDISKIPFSSLQTISIYKTTPNIEFFGNNAGGVIQLTTNTTKDITTISTGAGSFGYREGNAIISKTMGSMIHRLSINYAGADNNYPYTDSVITRGPTVSADDSVKIMDNNHFSTFSSMYSNTYKINERSKLSSQISAIVTDEGIFYLPQAGSNDGHIRNSRLSLTESYVKTINSNISINLIAKVKTENEIFRRFQPFYLSSGVDLHDISQPYGSLESVVKGSIGDHLDITGLVSANYFGFNYNNLLVPVNQTQPHYHRLIGKAGIEAKFYPVKNLSARIGGLYRYEIDSTNDSITLFRTLVPGGRSTKRGFPGGFSELQYQLTGCLGILASVQYSSRSPGFTEKFSEGARFSGRPDLRPETRLEYTMGFSFIKPYMAFSSAFFVSSAKDKIIYIGHSYMFTPKNVSAVNGIGLEGDITLAPFPWISIVNSITLMKNIVKSDVYPSWNGNEEPLLPCFMDNLNVKFTYKNLYTNHSVRFTSQYFTNLDNLDTIRQLPQLNAGAGCKIGEHFDLSYRIENYLNAENYDFQKPLPGLTQYAILKYSF